MAFFKDNELGLKLFVWTLMKGFPVSSIHDFDLLEDCWVMIGPFNMNLLHFNNIANILEYTFLNMKCYFFSLSK